MLGPQFASIVANTSVRSLSRDLVSSASTRIHRVPPVRTPPALHEFLKPRPSTLFTLRVFAMVVAPVMCNSKA